MNNKSLILGLLLLLLVGGCANLQPEPTPTSTPLPPTPTFTSTPAPTETPTPTPSPTPEPQIAFPPDFPCFIVFSQFTDTGMDLFMADCNTSEIRAVRATELGGIAYQPSISPNLRTFVYSFYDPNRDSDDFWTFEFFDMAEPDFAPRPLTTNGISGGEVSWSPDSRYIVYGGPQSDGSERDIYRLDVQTGERVNLTAGSPVWDAHPQWSPVDDQIVFVSDRFDQGKLLDNLWLMDKDGRSLRQLTNTESWEDTYPSWSPDGAKIAFLRWGLLGDESEGKPGLVVLDVASGEEIALDESVGFGTLSAPVWSPDGNYIAYFQTSQSDNSHIKVIPASGGDPIQITGLDGNNFDLSWSRDSNWIIFTKETDRQIQMYIVQRDGGGLRPLFPGDGNAFGMWFPEPLD